VVGILIYEVYSPQRQNTITQSKLKNKKEIAHNYMYVNCWTNQTILSALALLRKFIRLLSYIHWNDGSPQHCCSSDTDGGKQDHLLISGCGVPAP